MFKNGTFFIYFFVLSGIFNVFGDILAEVEKIKKLPAFGVGEYQSYPLRVGVCKPKGRRDPNVKMEAEYKIAQYNGKWKIEANVSVVNTFYCGKIAEEVTLYTTKNRNGTRYLKRAIKNPCDDFFYGFVFKAITKYSSCTIKKGNFTASLDDFDGLNHKFEPKHEYSRALTRLEISSRFGVVHCLFIISDNEPIKRSTKQKN